MLANLWLKPGMLSIFGVCIDAEPHQHHAIQLVWPTEGFDCYIDDLCFSNGVIINSNVVHKMNMSQGRVLLVEPNSELGDCLKGLLNGEAILSLKGMVEPFSNAKLADEKDIANLLRSLEVTNNHIGEPEKIFDDRISMLINRLNKCLEGDCIKPAGWKASLVASELGLSESRFVHLFSQTMGISWRPYLLWRRLNCAVLALKNGQTATEAAYHAGFSDSAHLSRTFKKHFGITIRAALQIFFNKPEK